MVLALDPTAGVDVATDAVGRAVRAGADTAKVLHSYRQKFEVNFDTHDVTLLRSTVSDDISITVFVDGARGSSELTGRAHDAVDRAVAQAVVAARAGAPDPANVLPDEPAEPAVDGGAEEPDKEAMVDAALRHIKHVASEYPTLRTDRSQYSFQCTWSAYANSHGRTQRARRGRYVVTIITTGKDGERTTSFNYTTAVDESPFAELYEVPVIARVIDDTMASFDPQPVPETFVGDVICTPDVMSTVVASITQSLAGVTLMRKATPYLERLGSAIAAPTFSLSHTSGLASSSPFDGEGFASHDLPIIRDGVLDNFLIDWYSSHKLGRPMTTGCADFAVAPGPDSLDDMIAATERGILLGRYSGAQPSQNLDFSGVAKNSFFIQDGKVVGPTAETMIAGNFAAVLENIRGVSRETLDFGSFRSPWVATSGVTISTR